MSTLILPSTPTFLKRSLILSCPDQNFLYNCYLVHACYKSCPYAHISLVILILIVEDSSHFVTTDVCFVVWGNILNYSFFCSVNCLKFAPTEGTFYRWHEQRSWARHVAAHAGLLYNKLGTRLSAIGRTLQLLCTLKRFRTAFVLPTAFRFAFPPFSFSLYFPLKHSFHHSVSW